MYIVFYLKINNTNNKDIFLIFRQKMQRDITDKVQLAQNLNPLKDAMGVESFGYSADFDNMIQKLDKLKLLDDNGLMDADLLRYIPGMSKIFYQGQIDNITTKKAYAFSTYTDKQVMQFDINLTKNQYTNFANKLICLPIKIKKKDQMLLQILTMT